MFSSIKIAIVLMMIAGAGGGFMYVKGLKADLATSEANNHAMQLIPRLPSNGSILSNGCCGRSLFALVALRIAIDPPDTFGI